MGVKQHQQQVRAKKQLGQHFLTDLNIAASIADSLRVTEDRKVIEVGPGMGVLTQFLLQKPFDLWLAEIDRESVAYLETNFPQAKDRILPGDFLRMDQKEVAQRIVAGPGSKAYGVLSVLVQAHYSGKLLFSVDKSCFTPPPKVQSAVIRLQRKDGESWACGEETFRRVVKQAFSQRRKMLRNSLKPILSDAAILGEPFFEQRPEQLSLEVYKSLSARLEPLIV